MVVWVLERIKLFQRIAQNIYEKDPAVGNFGFPERTGLRNGGGTQKGG